MPYGIVVLGVLIGIAAIAISDKMRKRINRKSKKAIRKTKEKTK